MREMADIIQKVRPYTFLPQSKLLKIAAILGTLDEQKMLGAIVECGVYRGGSSAFMATLSPNRKIWLLDSFRGLPQPTREDIGARRFVNDLYTGERELAKLLRPGGDLRPIDESIGTREDAERVLFEIMGIDRDRVGIVEGWLQDTLPNFDPGTIAFLHVDVDWYESTKLCLEHLYDNIVPGGYVGVDDYGYWKGCRIAVKEFLKGRGRVEMERSGSAVYWKVEG